MPHRSTLRAIREVTVELPPAEIGTEPDGYTCLICGKEYKTERGYENHLETHDE
jgi:hypothetical protein